MSALSRGSLAWSSVGRVRRLVLIALLAGIVVFSSTAPARADGVGETDNGSLLVQQALSLLAFDSSDAGIEAALEKIDDALTTDEQEGIDIAMLEQAQAILEDGDVAQARPLLQESIAEAMADVPPATGGETGTTIVSEELMGRGSLTGQDIGLLLASIAVLGLGLWLSWRFRPTDTVAALRERIGGTAPPTEQPAVSSASKPVSPSKEA